jgi:hypothetical protein
MDVTNGENIFITFNKEKQFTNYKLNGVGVISLNGRCKGFAERDILIPGEVNNLEEYTDFIPTSKISYIEEHLKTQIDNTVSQDRYVKSNQIYDLNEIAKPISYVQIKREIIFNNFSRLIRAQRTKHSSKLIICKRCFTTFSNKPNKNKPWDLLGLDRHKLVCENRELCAPVMVGPHDDEFIKFSYFNRADRIPIVIYADFECLLVPVKNQTKTKPMLTHHHKHMSYGFYVKISNDLGLKKLVNQFKIPTKPVIY